MEPDIVRRIALAALVMLPTPPPGLSEHLMTDLKDWKQFLSRQFPNITIYTTEDAHTFSKVSKNQFVHSAEDAGVLGVVSLQKVEAFINKQFRTFRIIEMQNRMNARDREENVTLYLCTGDEHEDQEVYGGQCLFKQHGAAKKIQTVQRGISARRRLPGIKISREMAFLPAQGPFPGGSAYREAAERAEGKFRRLGGQK